MALDRKGSEWILSFPAAMDVETAIMQENLLGLYEEKFAIMTERYKKYGPMNIAEAGLPGLVTRVRDKLSRILSIHKVASIGDDSHFDAALDGANYLDIAALWISDRWVKRERTTTSCSCCGRPFVDEQAV